MEPKKKPQADLNKRSVLFFQLGLIVMLFLSWQGIEYKMYEKDYVEPEIVHHETLDKEEIPIFSIPEKTPEPLPVPKPFIDDIEEIPNEDEGKEDFFAPIEDIPQRTNVDDIIEVKKPEKIEYSILGVNHVPVFPGCEKFTSNEERRNCMSSKIQQFVYNKFDRELGSEVGLKGINRIYLTFKIDENGQVIGVQSRGPHPRLEKEAERVINMLPEMEPGKQNNEPVKVLYSLPIIFEVRD